MASKTRTRSTGTWENPEVVDINADRSHLSAPEKFVMQMADTLAAAGREVQITRVSDDKYMESETLHVYAPAPRWYDHAISVSARGSKGSLEGSRFTWHLVGANVVGSVQGRKVEGKTYTQARIVVEVYGR